MLTLKLLRDDPEYVIRKLAVKHFDAREIVEKIVVLDKNRRDYQKDLDACLAEQKQKIESLERENARLKRAIDQRSVNFLKNL